MELPDVSKLAELRSLDRSLLHLFVAGPGEGEGVALALPGQGWVLIDGCRTVKASPERFPLEVLRRKYEISQTEPVELMVLTHPHADHCHGFAELIEEFRPRKVGLVGTTNPRKTLADEARGLEALRRKADTSGAQRASRVLQMLRAINAWEAQGHQVLALNDGQQPLDHDRVSISVRAPDQDLLAELTAQLGADAALGHRANWFSLVLEVMFEDCRLVLGGDLPHTDAGKTVPTGWDLVMRRHGGLVYHHGLKIPHHGSAEAIHADLMGSFSQPRAWCLTPFNSSTLPRTDDEDGLDTILAAQSPVMLTALSVSRKLQVAREDGRVTRDALAADTAAVRRAAVRRSDLFQGDDTVWRVSTALGPLDPVWCIGFDATGRVVNRWRGDAAVEVWA